MREDGETKEKLRWLTASVMMSSEEEKGERLSLASLVAEAYLNFRSD